MTGEPDMERAVGRIEGKLDMLISEQKSHGARLGDIAEEANAMKRRMEHVEKTVATIEPFANDFDKMKQRGWAIMMAAMLVWALVGNALLDWFVHVFAWIQKGMSSL